MSKDIHMPISSIYDHIKEQEACLIQKHTTLIDFSKLGFNARANILLKVPKEQRQNIAEYLVKCQQINTAYKINSGWDFMLEGVFRDMKELEIFLENMEEKFKIKAKEVYYIIDDIKREEFLADPELIDIAHDFPQPFY
jgi:DNA-binding Lrp family transcriptional regulator